MNILLNVCNNLQTVTAWYDRYTYWKLCSCDTQWLSTCCHRIIVNITQLQWRHTERNAVSNHRLSCCLFSRLFRLTSNKTSKSPLHWPFVRGIHRSSVESPHKGAVTPKPFPFDGAIIRWKRYIVGTTNQYIKVWWLTHASSLSHRMCVVTPINYTYNHLFTSDLIETHFSDNWMKSETKEQ